MTGTMWPDYPSKGNDMLPAVKKTAIAAVAALALAATPGAPAYAWGEKEQGFVAGVASALAIGAIVRHNRLRYAPAPIYRQPVYQQPVYQPAPSTSVYRTPAARAFQSYSFTERRRIQSRLAALGYYRGGIDGAFGPGTYSAITAYARDNDIADSLAATTSAFAVYDGLIL